MEDIEHTPLALVFITRATKACMENQLKYLICQAVFRSVLGRNVAAVVEVPLQLLLQLVNLLL